jgi:large subunit ribosomal protein L23
MNEKRLYQVILAPVTTEKSVRIADKNRQIVFKVAKNATKTEIKDAIQRLFSVVVKAVRTNNVSGKKKNFKQQEGKRSDWKKAYVSLAEGHDINLAKFE